MIKTILKIEGMACPMCESHANDAVRNALTVQKVTSSHKKGETVILSEDKLDENTLQAAFADTGYKILSVQSAPYVKKGLFGR